MAFTQEMIALSEQELVIRTSCFSTLSEYGYEDDIVIRFNMKKNLVEPLTWEEEIPFHYEFWGELSVFVSEEPQNKDFEDDRFQIELADGSKILYSEYESPTEEPWNRKIVRAIFKECVWQLTS